MSKKDNSIPLKWDKVKEKFPSSKPTELQKKAFEKAVHQTVEATLSHWKQNARNAIDNEDYIRGRIKFLNERISAKDKDWLKERIQLRQYDYTGFSESLCKKIISQKAPKIWYVYYSVTTNGKVVAKKENQSFVLAVDYQLKRELSKELESRGGIDRRETQGEKEEIKKYWDAHKEKYLTNDYKFKSSGWYNITNIAKAIKEDGKFNSHIDTIKGHAGLDDLE